MIRDFIVIVVNCCGDQWKVMTALKVDDNDGGGGDGIATMVGVVL